MHQLRAHIQRAGAEIEINARRRRSPGQRSQRLASPCPVDIHRQQVIQQVIARRDLGKDLLHIRALPVATGGGRVGAPEVGVECLGHLMTKLVEQRPVPQGDATMPITVRCAS